MKTVLTARLGSGYEDILEEHYHFPATYLNQIKDGLGDQFIYYEPRRTTPSGTTADGRQAYFAMGRLGEIWPDPSRPDHYFVSVENYLNFVEVVRFRIGSTYLESSLQRSDGNTNRGAFGRAVRNLPDHEFEQIVQLGFSGAIDLTAIQELPAGSEGFEEEQEPFERPLVELTSKRWFRDRIFTRNVQSAYSGTCAFTGIQILNGGGRPEAQAAHIKPVADAGPDSVRNGIALSGTIHWLFDRGLISIGDDFRILTLQNSIPDPVKRLFQPEGYITVPEDEKLRPNKHFLRYHRENIFKG